jgi:hypothetical protein
MDENAENPNPTLKERRVALWGALQVGKTTALATYFGRQIPAWVDQENAENRRLLRDFRQTWDVLRRNQLVAGTTFPTLFSLRHRDGTVTSFRDMRGSKTRFSNQNVEDTDFLFKADAALVFCQWPGTSMADDENALANALIDLLPERPTSLVITKCEAHLSEGEFLQFAADPLAFARLQTSLSPLVPLLEKFLAHFKRLQIAPITVYGWNGGRPAHFHDEFGRLVPWNIRPADVERPFEFVLHALGAREGGRR